MYALSMLQNSTATKYEKLTFPAFRYVLHNVDSEKSMIAIAASYLEEPIGLVLAGMQPDGDSNSQVLSIYVEPSHRGAGIGTALLTRLEKELQAKGCKKAELSYVAGKLTTPSLERLLQKCNWTTPQPRMLVCKGNEKILQAPWIKKYSHLPSEYTIFPWEEITQQERQAIQQQQETQPWIPEDLIPFKHEKHLEPLNSLGLRYQGQVVGWVINHRLFPDTVRYTCSFVRKDLQKMGRIISLYAEAAKRQYEANILNCIWTVPLEHESMVNFVKQRWLPYLNSVQETKVSGKFFP